MWQYARRFAVSGERPALEWSNREPAALRKTHQLYSRRRYSVAMYPPKLGDELVVWAQPPSSSHQLHIAVALRFQPP